MRKKIIAGNWKMNNDKKATRKLIKGIRKSIKKLPLENTRIIVAPSFVNLSSAIKRAKKSNIEVVAQNMHQAKNGAFTGEISAEMLTSIGIKTVILGHSERRTYFGETDEILAEKVDAVLENGLETIFCFGELLEDRKSDNHFSVVESQLKNGLFHLETSAWKNIVLAYEPVWAIGTGKTATPQQAQEMHAFIRDVLAETQSSETAENTRILYGGSVKPANVKELMSEADIDGALVGGASLDATSFAQIVNYK